LVPYPEGEAPGQRLKFEQQYETWRANGITVDCRPFFDPDFYAILYKPGRTLTKAWKLLVALFRRWADLWAARDYDVVYLFLYIAPVGPPVYEWVLKHVIKTPMVYDLDDANFLPNASSANPLAAWIKWPSKIQDIIPWASEVIVVTHHLGDYARKLNPHVTYIPPTINSDTYYAKPVRPKGEKVVLGWSGSHSTSPYLKLLTPVLQRLAKRDDVRFRVMGDASFEIPGVPVEAIAWTEEAEVRELAAFDIGLYPVPHDPWVLGKGGLKALQYMGMGVPAVCTPYGAVLGFIESGVNGFLADSEDEWYETLVRLIEHPEERERVGKAARQLVEDSFSVKAQAPVYMDILRRAAVKR
jgi:glycosyltransferase involved in cell wall biosynthesis